MDIDIHVTCVAEKGLPVRPICFTGGWCAALNTVEPPIIEREAAMILERDKSWYKAREQLLDDRVRERLGELSKRLGDADWHDGAFTAGDLIMVMVVRRLKDETGLLEEYPKLSAYVAHGEARPAFKRAFAAQLAVFNASSGAGRLAMTTQC